MSDCIYNFRVPNHNTQSLRHLTHWGRVTHIRVGNLTIIGSDNGLSPGRRQAITWTKVGILLIGPLGTNFSEILIGIQTFFFSIKKKHLKMSSAKWRPFVSAPMCFNWFWWIVVKCLDRTRSFSPTDSLENISDNHCDNSWWNNYLTMENSIKFLPGKMHLRQYPIWYLICTI